MRIYLDTQDSNFRTSSSSAADSNWVLSDYLSNDYERYTVYLAACSIPNVAPVFSGVNNQVQFYENNGSTPRTAVIAEGSYNGPEVAAALQTAMNSIGASNTYTATYNSTSKKLNIATTIPNTFQILGASTCLDELGFSRVGMPSFVSGKGSDYPVNLSGTRYFDIVANFPASSVSPNGRTNTFARVINDTTFGGINYFQNTLDQDRIVVSTDNLRRIELRVYDQNGRLVQIPPNHNVVYNFIINPLE